MISVDEALATIRQRLSPLPLEFLALSEAAGATLGADLASRIDLPPLTQSAMDGYAVRAADLAAARTDRPVVLPLGGTAAAGAAPPDLPPGSCARIFTGAGLPAGSDSVVIQETVIAEAETIRFTAPVGRGANVRQRGEEIRCGQRVLTAGMRLDAGSLALAAASNHASLPCHRRPLAAVLCSGDELRPPGSELASGEIAESNGVFLSTWLAAQGARPSPAQVIPDDPERLKAALCAALETHDLIVLSGGASVGDRDHSRAAAAAAGITEIFWKVAQKPGKPLSFGLGPAGQAVLILPGNPASVFACAVVHLGAALARLAGRPAPAHITGVLTKEVRADARRERLLRASLALDREVRFTPLPHQASHMLGNLPACDVLLRVPPGEALPAGAAVQAWRVR